MSNGSPMVDLDYDLLGRFYYNPHPKIQGATKQVAGIEYPIGTGVVIVAGKAYVFPAQGIGKILKTDPNFECAVLNVERMLGVSSLNDVGIRKVDLKRLEQEGDTYLAELDTNCANILMDTLQRLYVEALNKENDSRISRQLAPREPDVNERSQLQILEGLAARLHKQKTHGAESLLRTIRQGAALAPDFAKTLDEMGMGELRRRAAIARIAFNNETTGAELIAELRKLRAPDSKVAPASGPSAVAEGEPVGEVDQPELGGEAETDDADLLDETVRMPEELEGEQ